MNAGDLDAPDGSADVRPAPRPAAILTVAPAPPAGGDLHPSATGGAAPAAPEVQGWWPRLRHLVYHNLLHLDDTPHRIALGVGLGFFVGATPTLGFQMLIYFAIAAVVGGNKVSGIPPIWLTNPFTAVPVYYGNWRLGRFLLTGTATEHPGGLRAIESAVQSTEGQHGFFEGFMEPAFWSRLFDTLVALGVELWVGSVVVGTVLGLLGYWATYRAVIRFRAHRAHHAG